MSEGQVHTTGVLGVTLSWSLHGALSVLATILTIIVVGPKAIENLVAWYRKYWPPVMEWVAARFNRNS